MKTLCVAVKKEKKSPNSEYWDADYVVTSEFNCMIIAEHKKYFSKRNFVLNCLGLVWKQLWIIKCLKDLGVKWSICYRC